MKEQKSTREHGCEDICNPQQTVFLFFILLIAFVWCQLGFAWYTLAANKKINTTTREKSENKSQQKGELQNGVARRRRALARRRRAPTGSDQSHEDMGRGVYRAIVGSQERGVHTPLGPYGPMHSPLQTWMHTPSTVCTPRRPLTSDLSLLSVLSITKKYFELETNHTQKLTKKMKLTKKWSLVWVLSGVLAATHFKRTGGERVELHRAHGHICFFPPAPSQINAFWHSTNHSPAPHHTQNTTGR